MDKNENCLFDIICKVVVVICFFIMTITMISLNHKMSTYIQEYEHQFNVYQKLVKEYHRILFENEYRPSNPLVQENKSMFLPTEINRDKNLYNLENNNFKITSRFNSIMFMDLISFMENDNKNEDKDKNKYLLVIENDWNNIIKSFPGAFIRNKYGH